MKKRILSLALVLCMTLNMTGISSFAEDASSAASSTAVTVQEERSFAPSTSEKEETPRVFLERGSADPGSFLE